MSGRRKKPGWWHGEAADLFAAGWSKRALAARFGVSYSAVWAALNKDRTKASTDKWRRNNREKDRERARDWYRRNGHARKVARTFEISLDEARRLIAQEAAE